MTEDEKAIIFKLADAHDLYCKLPVQHLDDSTDWCRKIHDLQRMILARMAVRHSSEMVNIDDVKLHGK